MLLYVCPCVLYVNYEGTFSGCLAFAVVYSDSTGLSV